MQWTRTRYLSIWLASYGYYATYFYFYITTADSR
jgi:hypothetical protein